LDFVFEVVVMACFLCSMGVSDGAGIPTAV